MLCSSKYCSRFTGKLLQTDCQTPPADCAKAGGAKLKIEMLKLRFYE